jgi:diguanylate cyclase (GGDEF)-like protein
VSKATRGSEPVDPMFASYSELSSGMLAHFRGLCLLGADLKPRGFSAGMFPDAINKWLLSLGWDSGAPRNCAAISQGGKLWLSAIPLQQSDGVLLGAFCVLQELPQSPAMPARHAAEAARTLKPVLDCAHRELAAEVPVRARLRALTERTAELEWLFQVTGKLKSANDDRRVAEELLVAATERLDCALGVLSIPEKRLMIMHERTKDQTQPLRDVWHQTQQHLLHWAQRQKRPFLMNSAGRTGQKLPRCKILSVPVLRDTGRVLGVLAFFNPADAPSFETRHEFLARHLGRETAGIVDAQFDLMTGLYTRGGLEQMYAGIADENDGADRSIVYIDLDHMHLVNEVHGFELGNELIVRIADLLAPPLLPDRAIAARIAGDRFAVILPDPDTAAAAKLAMQLSNAAKRLTIGPLDNAVQVSISCGIAALVNMPEGLARAVAAAEIACKSAKKHGRDRVEVYACEDGSMMRRRDNAVAVGQLRYALKHDRFVLYAQRITPLQNRELPGGYELLLRVIGEDGTEPAAPGPLLEAALSYQLLPSVDRWVVQRALQTLGPYRALLRSSGLSMSINISAQSFDDESCVEHIREQLQAADLPSECITLEITEQAALKNLVRANDIIRQLREYGCRFALDDFGTGANSLTYLKNLQIARVKIDGSFIRDILTNRNSAATVRAIVELARGVSMDTVAEYVESKEIAQELRRLGVDYAQGYWLGKPEPLDALMQLLDDTESARLRRVFLES